MAVGSRGLGHCFDRRDNLICANCSGPKPRVVIPGRESLNSAARCCKCLWRIWEAMRPGCERLTQRSWPVRMIGASVRKMVGEGVDVIIRVSCDPQLGPVLLFGSGGVMVEVYNDVALRRCPITRREAQAMIAEVKGARLLQGFRGRPAADLGSLADTLVRVSHLAMQMEGHLAELDINPLMVLPSGQGVKAVDALVVFRGT
jgi:acyl-CoA synthetase (NDP forming)